MKKYLFFLSVLMATNIYCMTEQKDAKKNKLPMQKPADDPQLPEDFETMLRKRRSERAQSLSDHIAKDTKIDAKSFVKGKMLECVQLCDQALKLPDDKDLKISDKLAFFIDTKAGNLEVAIEGVSETSIYVGNAKYAVCEFVRFGIRVNAFVEEQIKNEYTEAMKEPGVKQVSLEEWKKTYTQRQLLIKRITEAKALAEAILENFSKM